MLRFIFLKMFTHIMCGTKSDGEQDCLLFNKYGFNSGVSIGIHWLTKRVMYIAWFSPTKRSKCGLN